MNSPEASHDVETAILIVNGGQDPAQGRWLALAVHKLIAHTPRGQYKLYVWNNNIDDPFVARFLQFLPDCHLQQAPQDLVLSHVHADPLQRLYEIAREEGAKYIVTLDSDAHPIRDAWLADLRGELDAGAALAGVWRDELATAIAPYLHASCLATTVEFIETQGLRLDRIPPNDGGFIHDTLSDFTRIAISEGHRVFAWKRSNQHEFHRLMGGVYGDSIYHHGAGSRDTISFWDEEPTAENMSRNARIGQIATHLLMTDYANYMAWLTGDPVTADSATALEQLAQGNLAAFKHVPHPPPPPATLTQVLRRKAKRALSRIVR